MSGAFNAPIIDGLACCLQTRFDLIFSADRYRKALEELKDQQKELTQLVKVMEPELEAVRQRKENIKSRMVQRDKGLVQLKEMAARLEEVTGRYRAANARVTELGGIAQQVSRLSSEVARLDAVRAEVVSRVAYHESELERRLPDATPALRAQQAQYDARTLQLRGELDTHEAAVVRFDIFILSFPVFVCAYC